MDSETECVFSKFLMTPSCMVLLGKDAKQGDLEKLERWSRVKLMKINKAKCKAIYGEANRNAEAGTKTVLAGRSAAKSTVYIVSSVKVAALWGLEQSMSPFQDKSSRSRQQ
ncbi:hypothetical protein HGM15179_007916 [Zosterops borbonicus]|uniref:Uncharacterized protein n=1 Tax=Zosterops borbonicus TaxID=364589 RepID=A0A8K1GJB8_9PASS|nr:hypothetical protein HGM15179_007916 [Zosterops borbonicus]